MELDPSMNGARFSVTYNLQLKDHETIEKFFEEINIDNTNDGDSIDLLTSKFYKFHTTRYKILNNSWKKGY